MKIRRFADPKQKRKPTPESGLPWYQESYCCGGLEVPLLLLPVLDPALGGFVLGLPLFGELLGLVLLGLLELGVLESGLVELGLLVLDPLVVLDELLLLGEADELSGEVLVLDPLLVLDGLLLLGEADELSGEVLLDPLLLGLLVLDPLVLDGLLLLCEVLELLPVLGEAEV